MKKKIRDRLDNIKYTSIFVMGIPEGEEKEKGTEKNTLVCHETLIYILKKLKESKL